MSGNRLGNLTSFQNEVDAITWNENDVLKLAWKNSWNHIKWTSLWLTFCHLKPLRRVVVATLSTLNRKWSKAFKTCQIATIQVNFTNILEVNFWRVFDIWNLCVVLLPLLSVHWVVGCWPSKAVVLVTLLLVSRPLDSMKRLAASSFFYCFRLF